MALQSDDKNNPSGENKSTGGGSSRFTSKEFIRAVIIALAAAVILKSFLIEADKIPSASMENTLLVGDVILVNKAAYELSTPKTFPLTNITIPSVKLYSFGEPKRGDVIVFKFPGFGNEIVSNEDVNYIKRIIGLPGDTVEIKNKRVYVNGKPVPLPAHAIIDTSVIQPKDRRDERIFPRNKKWNGDNYGPVVVPKKGMTIPLNFDNLDQWDVTIDREFGRKAVGVAGSEIDINGMPVSSYTFKRNYYFVMGDNRDDSMDSRYWGFVPDRYIIGKAFMIYWSWKPSIPFYEFWKLAASIRFGRIFKVIR